MSRARVNPALVAAVAGAADNLEFLVRRPRLFVTNPGRAAGSVASLALWATLVTRAAAARDQPSRSTAAVAAALLAGNAAVLAVHLRHRIARPRVFIGVAASGAALAASLRAR